MPKRKQDAADDAAPDVPGAVAVLADGVSAHLPHEPQGGEHKVAPWFPLKGRGVTPTTDATPKTDEEAA